MKHREEEYMSGNLTAMIDVVFQLIIFFVCTVNMQDQAMDTSIRLAMAPHGEQVVKKDPREVNVFVDKAGNLSITRLRLTEATFVNMLKKVRAEYGQDTPVVIHGDAQTRHDAIKKAMDACSKAGIYKIKFSALKEKGG